ncbi:hypothetical protein EVAR_52230_1 [Eumeta japonica]|uniref:Uncharacterized protein n=1 Tax=Eumeta variegata TaxID=151549 RepID=A0A4C1Z0A9_EUMVA|nr:hypothetical protein EVAR_52230_1 [Eumeta japonica]
MPRCLTKGTHRAVTRRRHPYADTAAYQTKALKPLANDIAAMSCFGVLFVLICVCRVCVCRCAPNHSKCIEMCSDKPATSLLAGVTSLGYPD